MQPFRPWPVLARSVLPCKAKYDIGRFVIGIFLFVLEIRSSLLELSFFEFGVLCQFVEEQSIVRHIVSNLLGQFRDVKHQFHGLVVLIGLTILIAALQNVI